MPRAVRCRALEFALREVVLCLDFHKAVDESRQTDKLVLLSRNQGNREDDRNTTDVFDRTQRAIAAQFVLAAGGLRTIAVQSKVIGIDLDAETLGRDKVSGSTGKGMAESGWMG